MLTTIRFAAADVNKPSLDFLTAIRMIAVRRNSVANVALPERVVSD